MSSDGGDSGRKNSVSSQVSEDAIRTLWMGDMAYWMDENFLYQTFFPSGEVTSTKVDLIPRHSYLASRFPR